MRWINEALLDAGHTSRKYGRKWCIALSGFLYLAGAALTSGAAHVEKGVAMLILGRIALGFGCGFGNTVCPFYLPKDLHLPMVFNDCDLALHQSASS